MIVNRDPKVRGPYTAFADVAGAYERGRPGYPDEAVRWLVGDEPRDVVDLGAGTGKLTRALVALGHRVTAVEPLDEMRAELEAVLPGVHARRRERRGDSASATPAPTSSRRRRRSTGSTTTTPCPRSPACFAREVASRSSGTRATTATRGWRGSQRDHRQRDDRGVGRRPDPRRERPLRTGRDRGVLLRAGARPRRPARPRPLAELPREASAAPSASRCSTPSARLYDETAGAPRARCSPT